MSKNQGKIFETDLVKSMPDYVWHLRIPDAAQSFIPNSALRFSLKNPFDFLVWNPNTLTLYALELKTVQGKSISFERNKNESKLIHYHQIEGLTKISSFEGIVAGFVIEFRILAKTVFIEISEFNKLVCLIDKTSFNYLDLYKYKIHFTEIPQQLLKTHYRYDMELFLKTTGLHGGNKNEI